METVLRRETKMIRKYFIATAVLLLLVANILFLSASFSWADDKGEIREDRMMLERKEGDCIVANNRCYLITEITDIKSSSGETISHSRLSTPCVARLVYYHNLEEDIFEVISAEILGDSSMGDAQQGKK